MTRLCVVISLAALLLSGCLAATGGKTETANRFNRQRFEERATRTVAVDGAVSHVAMNIYQVPEVIQVNFSLGKGTRVLSLSLTEKERLHIDRHLLWDREYVVDEETGVLSVQFELPAVYLADQTVRFGLRIISIDNSSKQVSSAEKTVAFSWSPMVGNSQTLTFDYGGADTLPSRLGPLLRQELERSDVGRFSPLYRNRINLLIQ